MSYTENQQTLFLFPLFIDARGSRLTYNQNTGTSQSYNYKHFATGYLRARERPLLANRRGVPRIPQTITGTPRAPYHNLRKQTLRNFTYNLPILEKTLSWIQAIITSHNPLQVYAISRTTWARESPLPSVLNRGLPSP